MYQNLINQNPIINQFNGYVDQNPNVIPFQKNQLINNNVHVMNNLNTYMQQQRAVQNNMPVYKNQYMDQMNNNNNTKSDANTSKNINIIERMLQPQEIKKNNKDVDSNYKARRELQKKSKNGQINIEITNAPYKSIIKDKIVNKKVSDIKKEDFIVHKSIDEIDADRKKFDKELKIKEKEGNEIKDELKIEFHLDNYDKHKQKYFVKETFIKNLAFEQNTFDKNKQDFVEFYKQKQKEADEGQKLCDQILHNIIDEGIIDKDELPIDIQNNENNIKSDFKTIVNNMRTQKSTKNNIRAKHQTYQK